MILIHLAYFGACAQKATVFSSFELLKIQIRIQNPNPKFEYLHQQNKSIALTIVSSTLYKIVISDAIAISHRCKKGTHVTFLKTVLNSLER